jgi:hypothetical protein
LTPPRRQLSLELPTNNIVRSSRLRLVASDPESFSSHLLCFQHFLCSLRWITFRPSVETHWLNHAVKKARANGGERDVLQDLRLDFAAPDGVIDRKRRD